MRKDIRPAVSYYKHKVRRRDEGIHTAISLFLEDYTNRQLLEQKQQIERLLDGLIHVSVQEDSCKFGKEFRVFFTAQLSHLLTNTHVWYAAEQFQNVVVKKFLKTLEDTRYT